MSISPSKVTVETNQLIRFLAEGRNSVGDSVGTFVEWRATGGTILADGRYSAAETGTFMVVGRSPQREQDRVDTAIVEVVRRQVRLASIEIAPGSATLAPGLSQTFLVTGFLNDHRAVPIGATWSATGGTIDAGGKYVAGDTAGTYEVIATHTVLHISDTAIVTISAPAPPPPPPPAVPPAVPPAPPAPVLEKVTLVPGSATLAPFATRKFVAFGRTAAGDSIPLVPTSATGGTLSADGVYSAGATAGTFRVIALSGSLADTSTVVVTAPLGSGPAVLGRPYGPFAYWDSGTRPNPGTEVFTLAGGPADPSNLVARIAKARAMRVTQVLALTGGAHAPYLTNGDFDMTKWIARLTTYATPAITAAIATGVADGTILGTVLMDEPGNTSVGAQGGDANSWCRSGHTCVTKALIDSMARTTKRIFPTLPVGYTSPSHWRAAETHTDVDFVIRQYSHRLPDARPNPDPGNVTRFIAEALAQEKKDGTVTVYSMNVLNGGIKVPGFGYATYVGTGSEARPQRPELWNCPAATTGGKGQKPGNCRMHPSQVVGYGTQLGAAGAGLLIWRHDTRFFEDTANQTAFAVVAASMARLPRVDWRRSSLLSRR